MTLVVHAEIQNPKLFLCQSPAMDPLCPLPGNGSGAAFRPLRGHCDLLKPGFCVLAHMFPSHIPASEEAGTGSLSLFFRLPEEPGAPPQHSLLRSRHLRWEEQKTWEVTEPC